MDVASLPGPGALALGTGVLVCASPHALSHPPPFSTKAALPCTASCAPGLCPCAQPAGAARGLQDGKGHGKREALPTLPVSTSRRQNHPRQPRSQRGEHSPFSSGLRVERHRPRGRRRPRAKPSKLHLLRIRADSTCPIAHILRAACSAPRRRSPQSLWGPAQLSSSGDLTTPGGLTLRTLNPGPHASWPRPSSRSHRRSSVGAGAG